jgi:hypothetical protein
MLINRIAVVQVQLELLEGAERRLHLPHHNTGAGQH